MTTIHVAPVGTPAFTAQAGRIWAIPAGLSGHAHTPAIDLPTRIRSIVEQQDAIRAHYYAGKALTMPLIGSSFADIAAAFEPTHRPEAAAPRRAFDRRLANGSRVRLTHRTRTDERHEFTVRAIIANGLDFIAVKPSGGGHRYNAEDYDLTILGQALPTKRGLYAVKGRPGVVYSLGVYDSWRRWDTSTTSLETLTAHSVREEAGAAGLVPLVEAGS